MHCEYHLTLIFAVVDHYARCDEDHHNRGMMVDVIFGLLVVVIIILCANVLRFALHVVVRAYPPVIL